MKENNLENRITILDGFRVLAILIVMLFHYYDRFSGELYQYEFNTKIFSFGYLGVEFFFIISGFVITLTLEKCSSFIEFIKKRFIRLVPGMLVCSILTFIIFSLFDYDLIFKVSSSFKNLIFSNTFLYPEFFNTIFGSNLQYVEGAYWSLWVEISFYLIISSLYFLNKEKFKRNYAIIAVLGVCFYFLFISSFGMKIVLNVLNEQAYMVIRQIAKMFPFFAYGLWFLIGILLLNLYKDSSKKRNIFYILGLLLFQSMILLDVEVLIFSLIVFVLLLLFVFKPNYISFLGNSFFSKLGLVSYSVYLIHQNVGILAIHNLSSHFGSFNWIIGLIMIVITFTFGVLSYKYLESPIGVKIKANIFKKNK